MTARSRVLYVTSGAVPGWTREALHAAQVARALAPWYELEILCPMIGRQGHVMEFHGARLMRVPLPDDAREAVPVYQRAVDRQLRDGVYETVHVRTPIEGEMALRHRESGGFHLVWEPSPPTRLLAGPDGAPDEDRIRRLAAIEADLARAGSTVVVHCAAHLPRVEALGADPARCVVMVPGVDLDVFDEPSCRRREGPGVLLLDRPCDPPPHALAPELRRVDAPWGPEAWQPADASDLALSIGAADLCVALPSSPGAAWVDRTPSRILEAIACFRPVVAPRTAETLEIMGPGAEPLLWDPLDPSQPWRIVRDVLLGLDEWAPFFADQALRVRAAHPASAMRHHLLAIHATLATPCGDVPVVPIIG